MLLYVCYQDFLWNDQFPLPLLILTNGLSTADADDLDSEEETPQLLRTRSDASFMNIQRRTKLRSSGDLQRIRKHRFSINGHFYNHKVTIFIWLWLHFPNKDLNQCLLLVKQPREVASLQG